MSHITRLLRERRRATASKADLEPPRTRTCLISGDERRGSLEARSLEWMMGGVKGLPLLLKAGRLGVDVRPVAMINFLAV